MSTHNLRPWNVRLGDMIQVWDQTGIEDEKFDVEVTREPIKSSRGYFSRQSRYVIGVRSRTYHRWNPTELTFYSDERVIVTRGSRA
jgi:hypothetical protein